MTSSRSHVVSIEPRYLSKRRTQTNSSDKRFTILNICYGKNFLTFVNLAYGIVVGDLAIDRGVATIVGIKQLLSYFRAVVMLKV